MRYEHLRDADNIAKYKKSVKKIYENKYLTKYQNKHLCITIIPGFPATNEI